MTLSSNDLILFNSYTNHLNLQDRADVLAYIDSRPGLTFNPSILTYNFMPSTNGSNPTELDGTPNPSWEPGFDAAYRWGNWVGSGLGANRLSDHSDFTAVEEGIAAKDVFDAIGRIHDLSIRDARVTLASELNAAADDWLLEMQAVRNFVESRSSIDAEFSQATETLGIRDGLVGYDADIRVLALEIMQMGEVGYETQTEVVEYLISRYQNDSSIFNRNALEELDPTVFAGPEIINSETRDAIRAWLDTNPPIQISQDDLQAYANYWNRILTGDALLNYSLSTAMNSGLAVTRSVFLNEFQMIYGSDAREQLNQLMKEQCFPAGTLINLYDGSLKPIEEILEEDIVLSYSAGGDQVAGKVTKLFTNTTSEFCRLTFTDDREALIATPGHRFLTETGDYMEIGHMLRLGGGTARVVDLDGSVIEATGELLVYSAETAHMFPEAQTKTIAMQGNTVLKEQVESGWQTYNFEVREHHNYVAGGVRVHNDSILSLLQPEDELVALSDDLRDAIVLRNVDADPAREIVLLDGYEATNGSTALERTINLSASGVTLGVLDLEAELASVAADNPLLVSQPETLFTLFETAVALFPGQTVSSTVDVSSSGSAIDGTNAGQSWSGTSADEWYRGNGGNDAVIRGNGGDDILEGGAGNDTIRGGTGEDMLIGDGGADKLYGDADDDTLNGGAGNDRLYGNDGDDTLIGGVGNDNLEGGQGDDNLQGGTGNDTIYTSYKTVNQYGSDIVYAGFGDDFIMGSNGKDKLYGGSGDDELNGGNDYSSADRDYLDGGYGNDIVISGQDSAPTSQTQANGDLLFGNDGDDTLIGGMANDVMNGGSGVDRFVFYENFGHDKIEDFDTSSGNEVIDLREIDYFSSFSKVQASMVDTGSDIVISTQNGSDTITLVGVENISDLFSTDFIYS